MTLETLLNKLIELGRKPRGLKLTKIDIDEEGPIFYWMDEDGNGGYCPNDNSINDLCSIDSGLRQFVCENGLYRKNGEHILHKISDLDEALRLITSIGYRLMLSSIQPNKEKFLLDNISLGQH